MRMRGPVFLLLAAVWWSHPTFAQDNAQHSLNSPDDGILLMAHGGGKDWNDSVRSIAIELDRQMPTELALGMADRTALQEGINKLVARGVKQICVVPLFVSSHSSIIESARYLLGLRSDAPKGLADSAMAHGLQGMSGAVTSDTSTGKAPTLSPPVKSPVPLRMTPALDRHPIVAEILSDRAAAIARNPSRDVLILVAHGPNEDEENVQWLADMSALASRIAAHTTYARIDCVTLRDDADAPVKDKATAELRAHVQAADEAGYHVLIVPLFLSYGGIDNSLRQRLDGLEHTMSPQALLPDPRIAQWVLENVQATNARR